MNLDESLSTLRFASTAKHIKNVAKVNEDPKDALLRQCEEQIAELRRQLDETGQEEGGENEKEHLTEERECLYWKLIKSSSSSSKIELKQLNPFAIPLEIQANNEMINKLREIENKAIIGGENLLEKVELQEKLLAETEAELEKQRVKEAELQDELDKKQAEILQIEESYGTLQEEVVGLNKKLKKVFTLMKSAQSELSDKRSDYAKLKEDMLETIRATQREIKLADFIIKHYIPGRPTNSVDHNMILIIMIIIIMVQFH